MSGANTQDNIIALSRFERKELLKFMNFFKKTDNQYSLYLNINETKEKPKYEKKNYSHEGFYNKYEDLSNSSGPDIFELEKELAKYIKFWHSTGKEYKVEPKLYQDDFFNEEMFYQIY